MIPDRYCDLQGPLSIRDRDRRDLKAIDARLRLRWQPKWYRYAVFIEYVTGMLYSQPVHICEERGKMRSFNSLDLEMIRRANNIWKRDRFLEEDKLRIQREDKAHAEHMQNIAQMARAPAEELARKFDITGAKLNKELQNVTRESFSSGKR